MKFFKEINQQNLDVHADNSKKFRFIEKFLYLPDILKNIINHPLNKSRKFKSIIIFFFFQIRFRILRKKKHKFKWIDETFLEVSLGDSSLISNYYTGLYEFEISSFIIHSIKKDYLFVDVGANLGSHSVLASSVARCNSIAFEPNKEALKKFERQLQINNIEKFVQIKKIAIGNKKGEVLFTNNRDALNRVAINGKDNSYEQVQVSTLDLEIESNKKIVLKIDVEGFEMNVLKGANNLLSSDKLLAIIVEINGFNRNYGIHEKDIHNLILSYNFHPYHYIPLERKLIKMNLELLKKNYHPKDYIYIKNIDEISFNCAKARKRVLHTAKGFLI